MTNLQKISKVIDRLITDAHNETGSVREYARSLLADLGMPVPADPECSGDALCRVHPDFKWHHTSTGYAGGQVVISSRTEPDPFDAAPVVLDLSEFGRRPFESSYHSRCRVQDDYIEEGEMIIKTPDGYAHLDCARDGYPEEIAEIEKQNRNL